MYMRVTETHCYSLSARTYSTQTNNDVQTSVTSLPPEFTRNQLRLSMTGNLLLLLSVPPLTSFRHSSSYSFLCYSPCYCTAMTSSALLFCSNVYLNAHFLSSPGQRGDRHAVTFLLSTAPSPLALLILSLSHSLCALTHNNKIPSAAISHQLHAWGVASQHWASRIRTHSQLLLAPLVCQSHLH